VTAIDPNQVKADFYKYRTNELERAFDLAVQALHLIIRETEQPHDDSLVRIRGTAGRALAAMGAAK
jgi:hypothetical protein